MKKRVIKLHSEIHDILLSYDIEPKLKIIVPDYEETEYDRRMEVTLSNFPNKRNLTGWILWEFFGYEVVVGSFSSMSHKDKVDNFLIVGNSRPDLEIVPLDTIVNLRLEDFAIGKVLTTSELIVEYKKKVAMDILLSKI